MMEKLFSFSKDDTFRFLELGVLGLVTIFVFLFVVRPMMATFSALDKDTKTVMVKANDGKMIAVTAPASAAAALTGPSKVEPPTSTEQMIEMSQINGAIQARSIEKVGEVATQNPQETVAILRQWLHGPA